MLQDTAVFIVSKIKLLAANETPLSSSKTTCSISAKSCWELKSKDAMMLDKLHFKIHKKFDGSTAFVEFFLTAMLRLIARNMGEKCFNSKGTPERRHNTQDL